jgi:hypothetical protein
MSLANGSGGGGMEGPAGDLHRIDAQLMSRAATVTTLSAQLATARAEARDLYAQRAEVVRVCIATGVRVGPAPVVDGVDTTGAGLNPMSGYNGADNLNSGVISWSNGFIVPGSGTTPPGGSAVMPAGWGLENPMQSMGASLLFFSLLCPPLAAHPRTPSSFARARSPPLPPFPPPPPSVHVAAHCPSPLMLPHSVSIRFSRARHSTPCHPHHTSPVHPCVCTLVCAARMRSHTARHHGTLTLSLHKCARLAHPPDSHQRA